MSEERDRASGRYVHTTLERLCTCGHRLGVHTAASSGGERPCLAGELGEGDCDCERFRAARRARA